MTEKVNPDEFRTIPWSEVQSGDVLMHENGDRLTVVSAELATETLEPMGVARCYTSVELPTGWMAGPDELEEAGFAPYRKAPELPTSPGAYLDKYGRLCVLTDGATYDPDRWYIVDNNVLLTSDGIRSFAPFTRLVPMPTGDQVRDAIQSQIGKHSNLVDDAAAAVMALLSGDANSTEADRG